MGYKPDQFYLRGSTFTNHCDRIRSFLNVGHYLDDGSTVTCDEILRDMLVKETPGM